MTTTATSRTTCKPSPLCDAEISAILRPLVRALSGGRERRHGPVARGIRRPAGFDPKSRLTIATARPLPSSKPSAPKPSPTPPGPKRPASRLGAIGEPAPVKFPRKSSAAPINCLTPSVIRFAAGLKGDAR